MKAENCEKISVSLRGSLSDFIEKYKHRHHCKSRSEVIEKAIELLFQAELADAYREADKLNHTINLDFAGTLYDGLSDETW